MKHLSLLYNIPPWLITISVTIIITLLLLLPQPLPDDMYQIQWFDGADKVVHGMMFAALGGAIMIDCRLSKVRTHILMMIAIATLAAAAYGTGTGLARHGARRIMGRLCSRCHRRRHRSGTDGLRQDLTTKQSPHMLTSKHKYNPCYSS